MQITNIVFLHPHFTLPGGAGRFVLETGKLLSKKGYKIHVISIRSKKSIVGAYRKYINFIDIGGPLSSSLFFWVLFPLWYFRVAGILNKYSDYILFPQVFPANWWGFLYKRSHPAVPMVWMCQEPSAFIHSKQWIEAIHSPFKKALAYILKPLLSFIDRKLAQTCDLVLANSNFTKNYAQRVYGFRKNKLKTLYLGVDTSFFVPKNIPRKSQILTGGRLTKFKNIDLIIKAFETLLKDKKFAAVKLVVVGEGEEKANLMNLVKKLKIWDNVDFVGEAYGKRLRNYYQASKIFILYSYDEPFGLVAVEALACGVPVIATNSGGVAEVVIPEKTGYLIPPDRVDILSQKMAALLENEKLYKKMSRYAFLRAQEFTWKRNVERLMSYLDRFI